jgi:hypothetical protein
MCQHRPLSSGRPEGPVRERGPRSGAESVGAFPAGFPVVLQRMSDFLGGTCPESATALFVAFRSDAGDEAPEIHSPNDLPHLLQAGGEVTRSLWDRRGLVVDLDVEYVNFDFPGEAFLHPRRSFALQQPVVRAVREVLGGWGIRPLHLRTGRGHHFLWSVRRESYAYRELARLGRVTDALAARYASPHPPFGEPVDPLLGRAFAGLGLLMEFLGHLIRDLASPESAIPVELSDLELGWRTQGLEKVVIDLSEYGDPLSARHVPIPFSPYLKPLREVSVIGAHVGQALPPIFVMPDPGLPEQEALQAMRNADTLLELARWVRTRIPDHSRGMEGLLRAYEASYLARFHDHFYAQEHDPPEIWGRTYDLTPLDPLPSEAASALRFPNDLLLKPARIFRVVEALLELGWHPRHVAGLIRARYERDHGWGERWQRDSAAARADHYARLFAGMLTLGRGPVEEADGS